MDLTRLRSPVLGHRGRIEFALARDFGDIGVGIVLNEKRAGLAFTDMEGRLDFNSGFRGNAALFHKWCHDLFNFHWNKTKKKVRV